MEKTENLELNILGEDDFVDVQVLNENTRKLDKEIQAIKDIEEITEEQLHEWYNGDTGVVNYEIEEMYLKDISFAEDTGLPNTEIEEMYQ